MPMRDFAFAGRTLRKSPVFALTAILTIALGVGASTAIFSVANAVLFLAHPNTSYITGQCLSVDGGAAMH